MPLWEGFIMTRDIFKELLSAELPEFLSSNIAPFQAKALRHMLDCQTYKMGFNLEVCPHCGHEHIHYNSCRDRNCPFCQSVDKELWLAKYQQLLLNVSYFHIVFTIPDKLNSLCIQNRKTMFNILFKAAADTLSTMAASDTYNFGKIGFSSILHTWGSNLSFHPHLHCIVTGGGLHKGKWNSANKKFFMSVKAMSKVFRSKFLELVSKHFSSLEFFNDIEELAQRHAFDNFISSLYAFDWVVYAKKPFSSPKYVLEYIGRYSHRIAIAPSRVLSYDSNTHTVTFTYKDYKDHSKTKEMVISAQEFLRRFTMHILPPRFVKIRHYGILSNATRSTLLPICRKLTQSSTPDIPIPTRLEIIEQLLGIKPGICPKCGQPTEHVVSVTHHVFHNSS